MERAKSEVESRFSKIFKFIQDKNKIQKNSKKELLGLVKDLHERCQSLYSVVDDPEHRSDGKKEKSQSGSSTSSSDVEYYSEEIDDNSSKLDQTEAKNGNNYELETSSLEITDLKHKLASVAGEKEALSIEYEAASRKLQEAEVINRNLRNEEERKSKELNVQIKEFERRLGDLKAELQAQYDSKGDLEEQIVKKANEAKLLREKNEGLLSRISELELILKEKGVDLSSLTERTEKEDFQVRVENLEQEIVSLRKQKNESDELLKSKILEVVHLREENGRLCTRVAEFDSKSQLDLRIEREKQNFSQMEEQNAKASRKAAEQEDIIKRSTEEIKEQQRLLDEQKSIINKLMEDQKIIKRWSFGSAKDSKLNTELLERRMEDLAKDFQMKMEDHLRILYRRIHVAEQIHIENKNSLRKARRETIQGPDNGETHACNESQLKRMKNMLQPGFTGSDLAIKKLDETGNLITRISKFVNEIQSARNWVARKNNEVEHLKQEIESLDAQVECREAQESLLKEKLSKLEAKLGEEGAEKSILTKILEKFEVKVKELEIDIKVKDVELLSLRKEKREAIRQLCLSMDYQRSRFDHLKRLISRRTTTKD